MAFWTRGAGGIHGIGRLGCFRALKGRNRGRGLYGYVANGRNLPDTALGVLQAVMLQNGENSNALHNLARHAVCVGYRRARIPEDVKNFFRGTGFGISEGIHTDQQNCQNGGDDCPLPRGLGRMFCRNTGRLDLVGFGRRRAWLLLWRRGAPELGPEQIPLSEVDLAFRESFFDDP